MIVGIFDFLRTVEVSRIDPKWAAPTTSATGYVFAAIFYFIFCYGMSRYAKSVEARLGKSDQTLDMPSEQGNRHERKPSSRRLRTSTARSPSRSSA